MNLNLQFDSIIDNVYGARDVKLTSNEIAVLSCRNPCVSLNTYSHQLIREMIPRGEGNPVVVPCFFTRSRHDVFCANNNRFAVAVCFNSALRVSGMKKIGNSRFF